MGEPLNPPVSLSVAYTYDLEDLEAGVKDETLEVKYARENSPATMLLEKRLAALEGAEWALAFNTGMAAIASLLAAWLPRGGRILVQGMVYGSTRGLASLLGGERVVFAGPPWDELLSEADRDNTSLVIVETIANPLLRVPPLEELARICASHGCVLAADNTMATPILLRPLGHGADLVVESLTKYVIGCNDAMGGLLAGSQGELRRILWMARKLLGTILQAPQAYLALRGLETLELRVSRASATALEVARWLEESGLVERVYYPCLPSHPDYPHAARILRRGCGGVVSFEVGSKERALSVLKTLKLAKPAPSFGLTKPVISYPYASSHRALPGEVKERLGITPGLLRLSVGLARPGDLIGDLERALRLAG